MRTNYFTMNYLEDENRDPQVAGSDSQFPDFKVHPFSSQYASSPMRSDFATAPYSPTASRITGQAPLRAEARYEPSHPLMGQAGSVQAPNQRLFHNHGSGQAGFASQQAHSPLGSTIQTGQIHSADASPMHQRSNGQRQAQFPQFGDMPIYTAGASAGAAARDIQQRIEAAKSNGWGAQLGEFLAQSRKRIMLVLGIVLLLAAGSYLSGRNEQNAPSLKTADVSESIAITETSGEKEFSYQPSVESGKQSQSIAEDLLAIRLSEEGEVIIQDSGKGDSLAPPFQNVDSSITKTANPGNGITHLARYALKDYTVATGKSLSAEQKVYAEDYVQNRIGEETLTIGQKLSFSTDLLREAVEQAEQLEQWQIENLKQYTVNVSLL